MKDVFFSKKILENRMNNVLKKFKLKKLKKLSVSGTYYTIKAKDEKGSFFIIKIRRKKTFSHKKDFLKEIYFWYLLKKNNTNFLVPAFLDFDIKKVPEYLIYSMIEGDDLGYYFKLYSDRALKIKPIQIVELLFSLQSLTSKMKDVEKKYFKDYLKYFDSYDAVKKVIGDEKYKFIRNYLLNNSGFINKCPKVLTHNDLVPPNVLLFERKKIIKVGFIDWSDLALSLPTYDICLFWLCSWNLPDFQKKLQSEFIKKFSKIKQVEKLFNLNCLILLPKYSQIIFDTKKEVLRNLNNNLLPKIDRKRLMEEIQSLESAELFINNFVGSIFSLEGDQAFVKK